MANGLNSYWELVTPYSDSDPNMVKVVQSKNEHEHV